jgi:RNA polymerase sigma-70 factor (ECF subfamily)
VKEHVQVDRSTSDFEQAVLIHLDAAYNLARWLMRSEHDAQDVVQEAYLRAFKAFDHFQAGDARCWLLTIVRNTCYTWLARSRGGVQTESFEPDLHDPAMKASDPQRIVEQRDEAGVLRQAIDALPAEFREVVIYRELEGLSYQEISQVAGVPVGTVMSRLSRARERLSKSLGVGSIKEA